MVSDTGFIIRCPELQVGTSGRGASVMKMSYSFPDKHQAFNRLEFRFTDDDPGT